jgi:23S rRNA pseudouridine1911/1915/1917 synthase
MSNIDGWIVPIPILYEDNHLIAVHKPSGLLIQGDKTGDITLIDLIKAHLKKEYDKPGNVFLGLIHRIDRPAAGIVVFAKTSKALARMNKLFHDRKVRKIYLAIVEHIPPINEGLITHYLKKNEKNNKAYISEIEKKDYQKAELYLSFITSSDRFHLLGIGLHTGRHHQIRAQLSHLGSPIRGDLKYGAHRSLPNGGIDLLSYHLEFPHPVTGEIIKITTQVPENNPWQFFNIPAQEWLEKYIK